MADMEIVRQFNSELSTLYATKPPISKAKVTSITRLALKAVKYYKHVVQSLEKFVQKCRPEYKIPALYVIDSIIRQSRHQFGAEKDVFGPRFGRNITNSFQNFFKCLPEEQSKLIKVLNLWQKNKVYSPEVIQPLLNMAHTRPITEQQGSPKLDEDVKAVPADTTQPVVGHMAQHHATQQPVAAETPQEQAYIALLQRQQEEQMQHIRELEARLQRQQQMNQHLQQGQPPSGAEAAGEEQSGEPKFQLPTEVFAQIQALASMVNQPGGNPPGSYESEQYSGDGGNYDGSNHPGDYAGGNPPDEYGQQYDEHQEYPPGKYEEEPMGDQNYQQSYMSGYEERQQDYMGAQQHQGFVDDFDYGDDQDDQQRMEEKKRQLEQEANRLNTTSSYEHSESMNARQHLEEQYQQMVSSIPPQAVPESKPIVPETLQPSSESAISAFQPAFPAAGKPSRSRSRSPRERRHRDSEREYRDSASDRERERGRDRQVDGSDRNRQRNRGDREDRDRTREDRDRARGDRDRTREKARGDRDERERPREERERTRDGREKPREKSRENRDEREKSREERDRPREERERTRDRERGRESDKETRMKEEQPSEEKKEVKIEKWVPPVKEGHVSVCSRTVWLGRMHRNTTKEMLMELFQEFGEVQIIDMVPPRGCAYIQMAEREAAYHSLSSKQIIKQNYKLAWAPAKGAKEYKEHFEKELGVTYIPVAKLQESDDTMSSLAEGGWIDPRTIPEALVKKEEAAAASNAAGQGAGVLGMPLGPPPFTGMPPGAGVPPGMPRLPFPVPGLPMPGMMPPGMNVPGMPGMQFPQGMGNMPFQRHPMNNRLPFMPGVNPFMMPGLIPGAPMPGMPPFFRGPPPMAGQPLANAPADAGQSQNGNQGEVAGQPSEGNQEGTTEAQGENAPVTQGTTESVFQGPPPDQGGPEGQNMPNNTQEAQGNEQFGAPNMGQGGGPPFQGGPPFHGGPGGPPFQPQFGQQGQPPFHGDSRFQGPPQYNDQGGGPPGPWRPAGPDNHWRPEGRRWGPDDGAPNEDWGNEREHWGPEDEHWRREDRWGRGNDRRGRRDRHSQDEWGREEHFDRRKRGRFDDDWGPHHERHQGSHHDRHRGRPPFGRDHPPRFGHGRGLPFPMDGPPPFDERRPWMRDEQRGRWGEEERPFRGDPMEQQSEAEQQAGFQSEQQGGGLPGRDANAPWDGRHGDGHHGDHPRDIPSLMGSQFEPPSEAPVEDSGVPENVASQEEVAKGWAEINELKARLARNKNPGAAAENSDTTIAYVEGQVVGGNANEQSIAGVHPDVSTIEEHIKKEQTFDEQSETPDIKPQINATAAPVEETADSSSQAGHEDNVLENQVKVKIEAPEEGDRTGVSGENLGVAGNINVDVPIPIIKDEPMSADEVSDMPDQASSAIAGSVSSTQNEPVTAYQVLDHPKDERLVVVPDVASNQERMDVSEPAIQVANLQMKQHDTADEVGVEKDSEPVVESSVDNMRSGEVNRELDNESRVSNDVSGGSEDVRRESNEVNMESDEVKVESSVELTKQSEKVNMGSEEVTMGSSHGNMESDEVNKEPSAVSMGSEITSDQVEVGSMETTEPENNSSKSEGIEDSVEPTDSDQVSERIEGGAVVGEVPDLDKKSHVGIESKTLVQQEADTTSNVPSEVDQIVADPVDTSAPESTEAPGDA